MNHNHHSSDVCRICAIISEKRKSLAELQRIVEGQSNMNERMSLDSPVLPRYKYGMIRYRLGKIKAASSKPQPRRIIVHPEMQRLNQERSKKLAELGKMDGWRFVKEV